LGYMTFLVLVLHKVKITGENTLYQLNQSFQG